LCNPVVLFLAQALAWTGVALIYLGKRKTSIVLAAASFAVTIPALGGGSLQVNWLPIVGASIALNYDVASLVTLAAVLAATILPLIHAWLHDTTGRLWEAAALACYASMVGLVTAWSLVLFYIYWELLVIASTILIAVWNRRLALAYFAYMQVGSLLLLVSIGILLANGVSVFTRAATMPVVAAILAAVGFAVKLGIVPFHTWLPMVYTGLPEPAAAVVSGAVTVAGAYGFYRFAPIMPDGVLSKLFWLGAVSAALGALAALASNKLAEIASYSSIGHGGFAFAGIAAGGLAAAGSLYMMAGHSIVKPLLFLVIDVVHRATGITDVRRLGLLMRTMPLTAFAGFVAALSLAGAPVFALFPGELAVVIGSCRVYGLNAAGWLAATAFLAACYAARLWLRVFWHPPALTAYKLPREPPAASLAALLALSALALAIGAIGGLVIPYLTP